MNFMVSSDYLAQALVVVVLVGRSINFSIHGDCMRGKMTAFMIMQSLDYAITIVPANDVN